MNKLDAKEVLPQNVIISSAENNLCRIGLCLTSKSDLNRNKLHNSLLIFCINLMVVMKNLVLVKVFAVHLDINGICY